MKKWLPIFLLTFFYVRAQRNFQPVFQHIDDEKLKVSTAGNQTWDSKGKLWAIYESGVFSFDGYLTHKWSAKADSSALLSPSVRTIYLDKEDVLWIGYEDNFAITKFDTKTLQFTHFFPDKTNNIPEYIITNFKEDSKGNFWVCTWGGGFARMQKNTGKCDVFKPHIPYSERSKDFANRIKDLVELDDGRYFVVCFTNESTRYWPQYFDLNKRSFERFDVESFLSDTTSTPNVRIRMAVRIANYLYVDEKKDYWLGTYMGLLHFDRANKKISNVTGLEQDKTQNLDNTKAYVFDENGRMWNTTPFAGLMIVDPESKKVNYFKHDNNTKSSLTDNRLKQIKKDKDGNIWIGGEQGGFNIYNPLIQQFKILPWDDMGLEFSNRSEQRIPVNQLLVHKNGDMFVSSKNGIAIYHIDSGKVIKRIDPKKKLNANIKNSEMQSEVGDIKNIGGGNYLMISPRYPTFYNSLKDEYKRLDIYNEKLKAGSFKILFRHCPPEIKTPSALTGVFGIHLFIYDTVDNIIKKAREFERPFTLSNNYAFVLKDGKWLLSLGEKGFTIFDHKTNKGDIYSHHSKEHFFPDSTIRIAHVDKNEIIWFGTGTGLYCFDRATGKTEYMNPKLGIGNSGVNAIIQDNSGIWWIALEKHLLRWDPKTNSSMKIGPELSLEAGGFIGASAQMDDKGRIYIATINGVLVFDPAKVKIPDNKPIVFPSLITINDDTLDQVSTKTFGQGNMSLKWDKNFIGIEFASDQIYSPVPHHFFYRLIGLDSNWQDNGSSNKVKFQNLDHGDYVLQIKLVNSYNISSDVLSIPFTINRPFWLTWWFIILSIIALGTSIFSYIKYLERSYIKQQAILEEKIRERTAEVVAKAEEIRAQKDIIFEKNKELTDSIHYAQKIQQSILPDTKQISNSFHQHFVMFKPKDIVSGDFYWFAKQKDSILWAVVDCTGHGVPGGFMSMLGSGLLNQIVNEELKLQPDEILNHLRDRVIIALKQTGEYGENRDGMDITLCRYIIDKKKLQVAAANNPLYVVRKNELIEVKADKFPIGIHIGEKKPFTLHEVELQSGDLLIAATDGYADQFGGPNGKKFKTKNLEKLLVEIGLQEIGQQRVKLEANFNDWKEGYEQVDDVCIIGVRI